MTAWCNDCSDKPTAIFRRSPPPPPPLPLSDDTIQDNKTWPCPSCGHHIKYFHARIHDLPGLPAGVKFDPSDQELLEHLEAMVHLDPHKLHPLIDEFIPTLEGENGICYTHPEKLPGVSKDGLVRHFFHRPSKAYTTGTRKRRKVHTDIDGSETRWHKTGKTKAVFVKGKAKGYKKILVLYINYGKQKKPEKTNWVMHQYHLGNNEDEKEGELVVSKIFYQTQPRQCGSVVKDMIKPHPAAAARSNGRINEGSHLASTATFIEYYGPSLISFDQNHQEMSRLSTRLPPSLNLLDGSLAVPRK